MPPDASPVTSQPAIRTDQLTKRFRGIAAFEAVTVALPPGSKTALVGANGAGKSTLLTVLSTLAAPSAGAAWIEGWPLTSGGAALRRRLGVLSHHPMLYEELTPAENLAFFARIYGVPDAPLRVQDLLREVGLWGRRYDPTAILSRGQHQRLALARALIHRPSVLLLDEPETGLDAEGIELLDRLALRAPGVTVLAATHRLDRIAGWADGTLTLDRGRLLPPAEPTPALDPVAMLTADGRAEEA